MDAAFRQLLYERCRGYCEVCGYPVPPGNWAAHHRLLRKHGGKDELVNVLCLHHSCHNGTTHSVHNQPKRSYDNGWLVRSWADPATTPLTLWKRRTVLLTPEGGYADEASDAG